MTDDLRRLVAQFDRRAPLSRAHTIPAAWYHSDKFYELERRVAFGKSWLFVARTEQLKDRGSYVTANVAGEPIVCVRGEDGVLRAFYNVCRHRAAQVMNEPCGVADKLRCRYHGWTYGLDGALRGVPEFDRVEEFSREKSGLVPVHVAEWGPLVFASLDEKPVPLSSYLAPMPDALEHRTGDLSFEARRSYTLECNWKVFVDNYLDGGYHVNTVHPGLAGVLDYAQYKTVLHSHASVQTSPLKPPSGRRADKETGAVRSGGDAQYWWIFPNLMVNSYEGVMDINVVWPLSPNRCRVDFDFFFAEGAGDHAFRQKSVAVAERIQQEDIDICEEVQRGLASRSYDTGRFSVKREAAGHHFHKMLAAYVSRSFPEA